MVMSIKYILINCKLCLNNFLIGLIQWYLIMYTDAFVVDPVDINETLRAVSKAHKTRQLKHTHINLLGLRKKFVNDNCS